MTDWQWGVIKKPRSKTGALLFEISDVLFRDDQFFMPNVFA